MTTPPLKRCWCLLLAVSLVTASCRTRQHNADKVQNTSATATDAGGTDQRNLVQAFLNRRLMVWGAAALVSAGVMQVISSQTWKQGTAGDFLVNEEALIFKEKDTTEGRDAIFKVKQDPSMPWTYTARGMQVTVRATDGSGEPEISLVQLNPKPDDVHNAQNTLLLIATAVGSYFTVAGLFEPPQETKPRPKPSPQAATEKKPQAFIPPFITDLQKQRLNKKLNEFSAALNAGEVPDKNIFHIQPLFQSLGKSLSLSQRKALRELSTAFTTVEEKTEVYAVVNRAVFQEITAEMGDDFESIKGALRQITKASLFLLNYTPVKDSTPQHGINKADVVMSLHSAGGGTLNLESPIEADFGEGKLKFAQLFPDDRLTHAFYNAAADIQNEANTNVSQLITDVERAGLNVTSILGAISAATRAYMIGPFIERESEPESNGS